MGERSIKGFLSAINIERLYLHAIFILIIVANQPVFRVLYIKDYHFKWSYDYQPVALMFYLLALGCTYFMAFVILRNRPSLKKSVAIILKIAGTVGLFFAFIYLRWFDDMFISDWLFGITNYPKTTSFSFFFHDNLVYAFVIILLGFFLKFMDDWYINDRIKSALEKQNLRLELDFLKSQVNPHFLFNTLNNIQSFIVQDEKMKSIELLGRLSEFMRFALYECDEEFIDLEKEVAMLADYVELERIRCDDRVKISFEASGDFSDHQIPTLLLMPFIENAFKHGADTHMGESWISITIKQREGNLYLNVENSFTPQVTAGERPGGIGLINADKRLQHYFFRQHSLQAGQHENVYQVILKLQLKPIQTLS